MRKRIVILCVFVFDLDLTLCTGKPYATAEPLTGAVEICQRLRSDGHIVIIQTARGMGTAEGNPGVARANIAKLTLDRLERWGLEYDEIYFGKPSADIYVDDKACCSIMELKENLYPGD